MLHAFSWPDQARRLDMRSGRLPSTNAVRCSSCMEFISEIRDAEEGGFLCPRTGSRHFHQGETWDELRGNVLETVSLHFEDAAIRPRLVQTHDVGGELIPMEAAWNFSAACPPTVRYASWSILDTRQFGKRVAILGSGTKDLPHTITVPQHNPLKIGTLHGVSRRNPVDHRRVALRIVVKHCLRRRDGKDPSPGRKTPGPDQCTRSGVSWRNGDYTLIRR